MTPRLADRLHSIYIGHYNLSEKTRTFKPDTKSSELVAMMHEFMEQQGYELDITDKRLHHEIYLSDARKVVPEKLKTVIRHPIKVKGS